MSRNFERTNGRSGERSRSHPSGSSSSSSVVESTIEYMMRTRLNNAETINVVAEQQRSSPVDHGNFLVNSSPQDYSNNIDNSLEGWQRNDELGAVGGELNAEELAARDFVREGLERAREQQRRELDASEFSRRVIASLNDFVRERAQGESRLIDDALKYRVNRWLDEAADPSEWDRTPEVCSQNVNLPRDPQGPTQEELDLYYQNLSPERVRSPTAMEALEHYLHMPFESASSPSATQELDRYLQELTSHSEERDPYRSLAGFTETRVVWENDAADNEEHYYDNEEHCVVAFRPSPSLSGYSSGSSSSESHRSHNSLQWMRGYRRM